MPALVPQAATNNMGQIRVKVNVRITFCDSVNIAGISLIIACLQTRTIMITPL